MKIMSFNTQHCLNYVTKEIDFKKMAEVITACGADIVGLNEMRDAGKHPEYTAQTAALAELTGLHHYFFAKAIELPHGPYGNGLLSRIPIVAAATISVPDPDPKTGTGYYETRCLLKAKLQNGLTVLVIHFGLNRDEQENAVRTVMAHLETEKCILMGDFNVPPEHELLAPIHAQMKDTADIFPAPLLSFPSDRPTKKIDYIFVSPDLTLYAADIPAIVASDHRPHIAEIMLKESI